MDSGGVLLREWEFLQSSVLPRVLDHVDGEPFRAWSVGSAADAVAIAVAFRHAAETRAVRRGRTPCRAIESFATNVPSDAPHVRFTLRDVGGVPTPRREACFERRDRRWLPAPAIAERVVLAVPSEPVDLVTLRPVSAGEQPDPATVLERVRVGGWVLFCEPPAAVPAGLAPAAVGGAGSPGLLFRRNGAARPLRAVRAPEADPPQSLADRLRQQELVSSYSGFARSLARRFARRGVPTNELEQVALLALVKAARRFDPGHRASFATYANATISGEIKRYFRDRAWMLRVPRSLQEEYLAVRKTQEELGHSLSRPPTSKQVADHLGATESEVRAALDVADAFSPASLDARSVDDEPIEIAVRDSAFARALDCHQLRTLLPQLRPTEQLVVKRLFFDGWTQQQVADEIGVSQMHISRLRSRALAKLRAQWSDG